MLKETTEETNELLNEFKENTDKLIKEVIPGSGGAHY